MTKFSKDQSIKTMAALHNDWLTDGVFDFEYKKYVLLAYLQHIDQQFTSNRLYPHLPELKFHLNSCILLRSTKESIKSAFPKDIKGLDIATWKPVYEESVQDDPYLSELNYILDFSIPKLSQTLDNGVDKFSEVGENIKISPLGIVPLRVEEGYLLFVDVPDKMVSIFRYQLALYNEMRERYLKTVFVDAVRTGIGNTVEQIKIDLIKKDRSLPNPAAYVVESTAGYPLHETLLPVTKHLMIKHLNVA
jgi:hypothetical protein